MFMHIFENGLNVPVTPIGITGDLLCIAMYAAPFWNFTPFAKPFLVPSGNISKRLPWFKYSVAVSIASFPPVPLATGNVPICLINQFLNFVLNNSSFAIIYVILFTWAIIPAESNICIWLEQSTALPFFGIFSIPFIFVLYIVWKQICANPFTIDLIIIFSPFALLWRLWFCYIYTIWKSHVFYYRM